MSKSIILFIACSLISAAIVTGGTSAIQNICSTSNKVVSSFKPSKQVINWHDRIIGLEQNNLCIQKKLDVFFVDNDRYDKWEKFKTHFNNDINVELSNFKK